MINVCSISSHYPLPSVGQGLDASLPEDLGLRVDPLLETLHQLVSVREFFSAAEVREGSEAVVVARGKVRRVRWMGQPFDIQLIHFLPSQIRVMRARVIHQQKNFSLADKSGRDSDRHLFQLRSEDVGLDGNARRKDLPVDGAEFGEEETQEFLLSVNFLLRDRLGLLIGIQPLKSPLGVVIRDPLLIHSDDVVDPLQGGSAVEQFMTHIDPLFELSRSKVMGDHLRALRSLATLMKNPCHSGLRSISVRPQLAHTSVLLLLHKSKNRGTIDRWGATRAGLIVKVILPILEAGEPIKAGGTGGGIFSFRND